MRRVVSTITLPISLAGGSSGGGGGGGDVFSNGVTLQAIDGGSSYYSQFSKAAAFPLALPNGGPSISGGWDSPLFFPIGNFLDNTGATVNIDTILSFNQNVFWTTFAGATNTHNSYANSVNMSMVFDATDIPMGPMGDETVGMIESDEPGGYFTNVSGGPSNKFIYGYINSIIPNVSAGGTYSSGQDGRFWWFQGSGPQMGPAGDTFGLSDAPAPGGSRVVLTTPILTPNGTTTRLPADIFSWDLYWFGGARCNPTDMGPMNGPLVQSSATVDQISRGNWYGDMVDMNRRIFHDASLDVPLFQVVETGGPYAGGNLSDTVNSLISSQEINWAVWASIIHGARGIAYFPAVEPGSTGNPLQGSTGLLQRADDNPRTTSITSGTIATGTNVLTVNSMTSQGNIPFFSILTGVGIPSNTYILAQLTATGTAATGGLGTYRISQTISPGVTAIAMTATSSGSTPNGGTIGVNNQILQTNTQVKTMARLINAQFAINYAWVSPAGYLYPHPTIKAPAIGSDGIDIMTKYYTGTAYTSLAGDTISTNTFYIFACTRSSQQQTNISATFHIADFAATSVTVLSDGLSSARTITISTPGQFTDTFEYAWVVRVYKINGPRTVAALTTKTIFWTTTGTSNWTVPSDWNPANANSFELIGGGAAGGNGAGFGESGSGGGGGEYQKITNQGSAQFQPGDTISLTVGTGGVRPASPPASGGNGAATILRNRSGATLVTANGGTGGGIGSGTAGAGGSGGSGGTTHFNGGPGGSATTGTFDAGTGGGAGGPNGVGGSGVSNGSTGSTGGNGGGGGGGGTSGLLNNASNLLGAGGGMNFQGYGAGYGGNPRIKGDDGFWGGGGGGGGSVGTAGQSSGNGGAGGAGNEWKSTLGVIGGSGGGGGGAGNTGNTVGVPGNGGNGGLYGGGGAGDCRNNSGLHGLSGNGIQGIIVITYQP